MKICRAETFLSRLAPKQVIKNRCTLVYNDRPKFPFSLRSLAKEKDLSISFSRFFFALSQIHLKFLSSTHFLHIFSFFNHITWEIKFYIQSIPVRMVKIKNKFGISKEWIWYIKLNDFIYTCAVINNIIKKTILTGNMISRIYKYLYKRIKI